MDSQPQLEQSQSPSLEDCLKLLKGERDEQRLAGLLLVTKFCKGDDVVSLRRVYDAVGVRFLDRLLRTGLGKGNVSGSGGDNRDAYLQLSVTVLAAFCRVPEIASSEDMVSKIPLILEIISNQPGAPVLEECYEFLYLVTTATGDGVTTLYESGGIKVLALQMSNLLDVNKIQKEVMGCKCFVDSHSMELGIKIVQLMLSKLSLEIVINDYLSELSMMVTTIARQFAVLHNALKFESLHLLSAILSSNYSAPLHEALRIMPDVNWSLYMHVGIVAILQNRVAPSDKLQALILAESMVSIKGEGWLISQIKLPDVQNSVPADRLAVFLNEVVSSKTSIGRAMRSFSGQFIFRCLLLVLESSRVEIAVLLNKLAYLKYEASKNTSSTAEYVHLQQNVAIALSLVEKIIKLISNSYGNEGDVIDESTFTKVINGLNETIGVVLEYLQDAKEHGQKKGNDLLASVRLVGSIIIGACVAFLKAGLSIKRSAFRFLKMVVGKLNQAMRVMRASLYLAETPIAYKEKVGELLEFMLSVEGEDEPSPFYSVCFLLPMLCQSTMEIGGIKALASSGGYKPVVECLIKVIGPNCRMVENDRCIFLACDTILNLLLKKDQVQLPMDHTTFVNLLKALAYWTENTNDPSIIMMASSICALILDSTSEKALVNRPNFDSNCLNSLSRLFARSLAPCGKDTSDFAKADMDLLEIVTAGYSRWAHRFPHIKAAVGR
ncbi:hypothetical protein EZV62_013588 [Acer yangbiense]|uniref:Neurochondrin n=1 Tax=Acer yangbiense TaxID=1000413 RepID=A0A5C7HZE4_9ROSI|nr:hypothetical protein EZV62_013588 [Acer yangbiense]